MKTLTNILIFLGILFVGIVCRLAFLDKPEGLWNDEYIGWWIASTGLNEGFFQKMFGNCHMPLYYFFLKIWMYLFGDADFVLRLSSVFVGILCIVSSFFLGKIYKNKDCGLVCAGFASVSGFLIYFSQEVRLYSLIFLISSLVLIYFIKTLRNPNKLNLFMYVLFNFLLLITHTIGFVYVFFNVVIFSILLVKNYPKYKFNVVLIYLILLFLFSPLLQFLFDVMTRETLSQNWGEFTISKIVFCFIDYLTPFLTNITNSPLNLITFIKNNNVFDLLVFICIPFLISLYFVCIALKQKEKVLNSLFICSLLCFGVLIIAAILGKLILSTKYSVEIFPTLILLFAVGCTSVWSKLNRVFIVLYILICLVFISTNPNAPQKQGRVEGHKTPVTLLKKADISQEDYVISLYHQFFRYQKYLEFKPKNIINIDKNNIGGYLVSKNYNSANLVKDGKKRLYNLFQFKDDIEVEKKFDLIFEQIPKGRRIYIIIPAQVAFFSSNDLKRIVQDEKDYNRTQIIFMAFSYAKIKLINSASKYCDLLAINQHKPWYVLTFIKK